MAGLSKLLKVAAKAGKDAVDETVENVEEAKNLLGNPKKIDDWKKQNQNPNPQKRNPDVEKAANDLLDGKITGKQYRSIVKENTPIKKIEEVPAIPTFKEIVGSLNKDKSSKGILGLTKNIEDGTRVSSRLDIPAYEKHDVWVVSLHNAFDKKGRADSLQGDILGYGKTAVLKNVEFKTLPQGASRIAAGRADKGTIARIFGDYYNENPATTKVRAEQVLNDPEWTQVGFNPFKHGYFYDKDTGMPIKSADEVLQVGALVLAKNTQKFKVSEAKKLGTQGGLKIRTEGKTETIFNKGGVAMEKQMKLFQEGGLEQDGGTVDPVSGNEVPVGSAQEEVRDDIDARLSEGEFVFPADVVRYIGLEKLMQLRQEAKAGLARMEEMGQMGNSDEATIPDDIPFSPEDITATDDAGNEGDLEMQTGGFVPTPYGTQPHQGSGVYSQPSQMGSQFNINPNYQFQPPVAYPMVMPQPQPQPQPQTGYVPSFVGQQPMQQPYTGFNQLIPMPTQQYNNIRFVNAAGEVMIIPHVDGKPVFPIPEGYSREDKKGDTPVDETPKDDVGETETSVPTATVTKPKEDTDRMFVDGKWMTKEQRIKAEDEKNMNRSYDMIVEQMRQKYPDISNEEILKKIKAGEGTVNVFGKEFKAPGMLFTEDKINEALNRYDAGGGPFEDTAMPTLIRTEDGTLKTSDDGTILPDELSHKSPFDSAEKVVAEASKPKTRIMDLNEGDAGEADARKEFEKKQAEEAKRAAAQASTLKLVSQVRAENAAKAKAAEEAKDRERLENEANRAKTQQEKTRIENVLKDRNRGSIRRGFKEGGIASKSKKKTMKRGGLASKK